MDVQALTRWHEEVQSVISEPLNRYLSSFERFRTKGTESSLQTFLDLCEAEYRSFVTAEEILSGFGDNAVPELYTRVVQQLKDLGDELAAAKDGLE